MFSNKINKLYGFGKLEHNPRGRGDDYLKIKNKKIMLHLQAILQYFYEILLWPTFY